MNLRDIFPFNPIGYKRRLQSTAVSARPVVTIRLRLFLIAAFVKARRFVHTTGNAGKNRKPRSFGKRKGVNLTATRKKNRSDRKIGLP